MRAVIGLALLLGTLGCTRVCKLETEESICNGLPLEDAAADGPGDAGVDPDGEALAR